MRLKAHNILGTILLVLCMTGCSSDPNVELPREGKGSVNFAINIYGEVIEQPYGRAAVTDPKPITRLWYAIINSRGEAMQIKTQYLKPDFSSLQVEGLAEGNYSIVFLATTGDVAPEEIGKIDNIAQQWLVNSSDTAPFDEDYLYNRIDFAVASDQASQSIDVELRRATGRVEVDIRADNAQSLRYITNIDITYDESSSVYKQMSAEGSYSGTMVIKGIDITQSRGFYSLPSVGTLSGVVTITALMSDGEQIITTHRFTGAKIEAGVISTLAITYTHPEDNKGFFTVTLNDYTPQNSTLILQDDEPREVFYNNSLRSFYIKTPLQVTINDKKELQVRFYSAIAVKDIRILVRFRRYSNEFYDLAHYEKIPAFHESRLPMPIVTKARVFTSRDGRNILIPAHPNLSIDDCEFKIESNDPYLQKIATITPNWRITYNRFTADNPNPGDWRHMTPALCREGVVLMTNMAFMFSQEQFVTEMDRKREDGSFWYKLNDNAGVAIEHSLILSKIKAQAGFNMGAVGRVEGLGSVGGPNYGLASYHYSGHYWDHGTAANFHKSTAYHELGHCIGYGHSSSMTYGDQWTVLCSRVMYDMGAAGKLPVNSRWVLNTNKDTSIPPKLPHDDIE